MIKSLYERKGRNADEPVSDVKNITRCVLVHFILEWLYTAPHARELGLHDSLSRLDPCEEVCYLREDNYSPH